MRWCVAVALISTLLSSNALAAPKAKKGKNKKDDKSGASMETTGHDPVGTEKSDPGPYAPKGMTGAAGEEAEHVEEVKQVVKAKPRDKALLFADVVVGFGNSPKPGPNRSNASGGRDDQLNDAIAGSLLIGGRFDLSPKFSLGFRLPVGASSVDRGGTLGKQTYAAVGAIEVLGEYRHYLSPLTSIPILFGLGLPTGTDDPDPSTGETSNRTNTILDSARGWRDGELFWAKRVPLILGVGIRHEGRSFEVRAATKFVAGFRIAGDLANPNYYGAPRSELVNNFVAMRSVTDVGFTYSFGEKFWAGADLWAAANIIEPIHFKSTAEPPFLFQFVAEPLVGLRFGKIRPNVGFIIPLNGRLADGGMYGGQLRVDVAL